MKRKWAILFGVLIFLGIAAFTVFQMMQQPEVTVMKTELTSIKETFTEEGVVVPNKEKSIYSLHTARISKLLVSEGSSVAEGELLLILDESELRFTLKELEAHLSSLDAEKLQLERTPGAAELESFRYKIEEAAESHATAKQNFYRMEQLYTEGVIAKVELEEAEELVRKTANNLALQEQGLQVLLESYEAPKGSREALEAQRKAILAQMDLIKYQMDNFRIYAPIGGLVTGLTVEEGGITGPQAPILKIFQPHDYRVETRVLTSDVHDLSLGTQVKLLLELRDGDITFPGEVTVISPFAESRHSALGLEEERVKVTIVPELPDHITMAPGYKVDVEFTTAERSDVIVVPKTALFAYEGEDALLVIEDGRAKIRPVKTGMETRQEVAITEGLDAGELIIIEPEQSGVAEGARVSFTVE